MPYIGENWMLEVDDDLIKNIAIHIRDGLKIDNPIGEIEESLSEAFEKHVDVRIGCRT